MISIVIPAYNEQDVIIETIDRCKKVLAELFGSEGEVIVVDDCSKDKTYELAKSTGITVLTHPHNAGYGRSLKDGISAAKYDIIVITDSDGTYPIESIPQLYQEYLKGFDMVVGARQGKNYDESFKKKILRKLLKFLVEYTAGRKIDDINSGLRIFSKQTIMNYFDTLCDTFSFTTSVTLAYMMTGKFVKYIPIEYHKRVGKSHVKLFKDTLRTLQYIIEAILFYNPIKIFLIFCFCTFLSSMISLAIGFVWQIKSAFYLSVGCLLVTFILFGLGMVSVLLKQILFNSRFKT
ncbi:MAG: glycosyltransferase family 2 protein [Sphingobacteriaceae bacterium]|nr:glycosyltransferase family 2 protein [Sphingobacteriaceae bacterium]